jgi:hypothetical protein
MGIYFVFFSPHSKKKGNPTAQTAHLQIAPSLPCNPKFAKELFPQSREISDIFSL